MLALIAAVTVAAAAPAPRPAARPVNAASIAAATQLVEQLGIRGELQRTMARNVELMRSGVAIRSMLAQQPGFVAAYKANQAKFDPALRKAGAIQAEIAARVIRENSAATLKEAVLVYARNYSAAELQGLTAFYKTPLGQAFNTRQGKVAAEIGGATARLIGQKIDAAMQAAAPRLQAALAPLNTAQPGRK